MSYPTTNDFMWTMSAMMPLAPMPYSDMYVHASTPESGMMVQPDYVEHGKPQSTAIDSVPARVEKERSQSVTQKLKDILKADGSKMARKSSAASTASTDSTRSTESTNSNKSTQSDSSAGRQMFHAMRDAFSKSHPYTAVTVQIDSLTSDAYDEDDYSGIPELVEAIDLQITGATEAARAIRKKLKYANVQRQLRALTILDGILENGGSRIQKTILSDQPLLERLRIAAVDPMSDVEVRQKCKVLFSEWMAASKENEGLKGAVHLFNQLPNTKTGSQRRDQSRVLRENEEAAQREMDEESEEEVRPRPTNKYGEPASRKGSVAAGSTTPKYTDASMYGTGATGFKKEHGKKEYMGKKFKIEKERPQIYTAIAQSSVAATDLANSLKRVNREHNKISDDKDVMKGFERCKNLRRQILRYIQLVETDEFIGGLIHANEELVTALMAFEVLDKSVEDDSDSEMEEAAHQSRQAARNEAAAQREAERLVAKLTLKESQEDKGPKKPNRLAKPPAPIRSPPPSVTVSPPAQVSPARPPPSKAKAKAKAREPEPESESEESDDDPFGDKNMINTPDPDKFKKGYSWKEV